MSRKPKAGILDGTRCICYIDNNKIKFLNRRGIWFEHRYPEVVSSLKINAKKAILDGEIYVADKDGKPNFYKLAEREHTDDKLRIDILSKQIPATYAVFDVLYLNEKDLTNLPLIERKNILDKIVKETEKVKKCFFTKNGKELWKIVKKIKLEGIVAKKVNSVYEIGKRSKNWLKIKTFKTLDLIITGFTTGTGKRKDIGSVITGCYYKGKLIYTGKIGTGLDEEGWKSIFKDLEKIKTSKCPFEKEPELDLPNERKPNWVKLKYVCEAKFMSLTENLQLRAPVFLRIREDKRPEECILEEAF
ncbi:MAG: non-homologous end-joining DNA ligase [Candidatus Aenigmatarchaeota archaeon]